MTVVSRIRTKLPIRVFSPMFASSDIRQLRPKIAGILIWGAIQGLGGMLGGVSEGPNGRTSSALDAGCLDHVRLTRSQYWPSKASPGTSCTRSPRFWHFRAAYAATVADQNFVGLVDSDPFS